MSLISCSSAQEDEERPISHIDTLIAQYNNAFMPFTQFIQKHSQTFYVCSKPNVYSSKHATKHSNLYNTCLCKYIYFICIHYHLIKILVLGCLIKLIYVLMSLHVFGLYCMSSKFSAYFETCRLIQICYDIINLNKPKHL